MKCPRPRLEVGGLGFPAAPVIWSDLYLFLLADSPLYWFGVSCWSVEFLGFSVFSILPLVRFFRSGAVSITVIWKIRGFGQSEGPVDPVTYVQRTGLSRMALVAVAPASPRRHGEGDSGGQTGGPGVIEGRSAWTGAALADCIRRRQRKSPSEGELAGP